MPRTVSPEENFTDPAGADPSVSFTVAVNVAGVLVPYVCSAADAVRVVVLATSAAATHGDRHE